MEVDLLPKKHKISKIGVKQFYKIARKSHKAHVADFLQFFARHADEFFRWMAQDVTYISIKIVTEFFLQLIGAVVRCASLIRKTRHLATLRES